MENEGKVADRKGKLRQSPSPKYQLNWVKKFGAIVDGFPRWSWSTDSKNSGGTRNALSCINNYHKINYNGKFYSRLEWTLDSRVDLLVTGYYSFHSLHPKIHIIFTFFFFFFFFFFKQNYLKEKKKFVLNQWLHSALWFLIPYHIFILWFILDVRYYKWLNIHSH